MQLSPISSSMSPTFNYYYSVCSSTDFAEMPATFSKDFTGKLKLDVPGDKESLDDRIHEQQQHHEDEEGEASEDEEEFEFSFVSTDPDGGSPISADDIFSNGEIRPIFPLFNRDLLFAGGEDGDSKASTSTPSLRPPLRKIFVEQQQSDLPSSGTNDCEEEGPVEEFCVWTGKTVEEASPEMCKKSNSTGFCRLWRFRDLLHRSSSDGKDAFVFLQPSNKTNHHGNDKKVVKIVNVEKREVSTERKSSGAEMKGKAKGEMAPLSAHAKHYERNRAMKEGNRRRTYLPYRQDLVGFFTNVNGLSRNLHPF